MKKRLAAFACALLMLFCCTLPTFALGQLPLDITVTPIEPTTAAPTASEKFQASLNALWQSIQNYMAIVILILVVILVAVLVIISEKKQQKERDEKRPPKKQKKNK